MILVDTSVLIDLFKGNSNAKVKKLKSAIVNHIPFGITSVIYQELLQGAKNEKEYRLLKQYLETQVFFQPGDVLESYASAAEIFFTCRQKGITIRNTIDCLIAQIAIDNDLYLLHNDKDFDNIMKVSKLKVY